MLSMSVLPVILLLRMSIEDSSKLMMEVKHGMPFLRLMNILELMMWLWTLEIQMYYTHQHFNVEDMFILMLVEDLVLECIKVQMVE